MRLLPLPLGLILLSGSLFAEPPGATVTPTNSSEGTTQAANRSNRAMGSALTAGIKYSPPPPEPPPKEEDAEKPKNEIVRLPNYVVTASRPPIFSDRALRDQKERGKFAVKKYLSEFDRGVLNGISGPAWTNFSNEKRAEQMAYDANRQKTIETIDEHSVMYEAVGDDRRAQQAKEDKYNTTLRRTDNNGPRDGSSWYGELR